MTGKEKCAILKQIRRDIAAKNDISLTIAECKHQGDCKGTCPRCEAEVEALERALEKRRRNGLRNVLTGISAGLLTALHLTSCGPEIPAEGGDVPKIVDASETDENGDPTAACKNGTDTEDPGHPPVPMGDIIGPVEIEGEVAVPETELPTDETAEAAAQTVGQQTEPKAAPEAEPDNGQNGQTEEKEQNPALIMPEVEI